MNGMMRVIVPIASVILSCSGCTTFSHVRPAEVSPGLRLDGGVSLSTPPGDPAAWFWTYDCGVSCDHLIFSPSLSATFGSVGSSMGVAHEIGAGFSGINPYVEGYLQLRSGLRPFGVGARVGLPLLRWREDALYARYDVPLRKTLRLLVVPSLYRYGGNSPNGANPGSFIAFVQGVGLEHQGFITPWAATVLGRTRRESYGVPTRGNTVFLVLGASIRLSPKGVGVAKQ